MTALRNSSNKNTNLISDFLNLFDIEFAASAEQKAAVYNVRYNVYCLDKQFEPAENFPDRQEKDEFDPRSLHCLITHKRSGIHAGCVRVVSSPGRRETDLLPFEKHCPEAVGPEFFRSHDLHRDEVCEVSRLAVDGRFRKLASGEKLPEGMRMLETPEFSEDEMRTFPLIASAGFLAATAMAAVSDQQNIFAFMEPYLPRLMRRAGLSFERAGQDVEYNGKRAAYFIKTQDAINYLQPSLGELYQAVAERIAEGYESHTTIFDAPEPQGRPALAPLELVHSTFNPPAFIRNRSRSVA